MIATTDVPAKKNKRHTPAQLATLNAYYKNGMVGVGEIYAPLIHQASAECNLAEKKVKVFLT